MRGESCEGLLPRQEQCSKALARTQVYLSKNKLRRTSADLAIYILKGTIGAMSHGGVKCENNESGWGEV